MSGHERQRAAADGPDHRRRLSFQGAWGPRSFQSE